MKNVSQSQIIGLEYSTIIPKVLKVAFKKVPATLGDSDKMVRVVSLQWFRNWYMGFGL